MPVVATIEFAQPANSYTAEASPNRSTRPLDLIRAPSKMRVNALDASAGEDARATAGQEAGAKNEFFRKL
jgi:hypothetical protein